MSKSIHILGYKAFLVSLVLAGLALMATLPLVWRDQLIFGIALYGLCVYLHTTSRGYRVTVILIILSMFCTVRYCIWRYMESWRFLNVQGSESVTIDILFVTLLLAAETYAAIILILGNFQGLKPLCRKPVPLPEDPSQWPVVDVFIPTYNEPIEVVKWTVIAAMNMDYPADRFQVYILDDGRRAEFRQLAEEHGVVHLTRDDNRHAKAGNINAALKNTNGGLVAIFDCDHVPTRSFLQLTVGWFLTDEKLGLVQTPHHFYSPDPFERNLSIFREVPNESSLFYGIVQDGNDLWNATFFCGSCAVIRRSALDEIGGVAVETVTEDAHTSLRLQRRGWNTAYINIPQAAGLATSRMADHIGQRIRWARGMVQIFRVDNPLLGRGLTIPQRLCYFNSVVHYLNAVPRLIFLTAPLVYLLLGLSNMFGSVITILAYALPHLLMATLTNSRIQGKYRHSFWNEVYETVLAPFILLPTMLALINPKWGTFNVTSKSIKSERTYMDWHVAWPFVVLLILNLAGIAVGVTKVLNDVDQWSMIGINVFWSSLNAVVLGAAVASTVEKKQLRLSIRVPTIIPVQCELLSGETFATATSDIGTGGAALTLEHPMNIQLADLLTLNFQARGKGVPIPAIVTDCDEKTVRVAFHHPNLKQEEQIALLVFSNADLWNSERITPPDRPLYSFLRILEIAGRGFAAIPASLVGWLAEGSKGSAPASGVRRRPAYLAVLILMIAAALLAIRAPGQDIQSRPAAASSSATSGQTFRSEVSFREAGRSEGLELSGTDASVSFSFAIPITKLATEAQLILRYRLAPALRPEASHVDVSLNGSPVGTVSLSSSAGSEPATAMLTLPSELLSTGNRLELHLLGQCDDCNPKDKRRLVSRIDETSEIQYSGAVLPFPMALELLPQPFFDPASAGVSRIGFYLPTPPDRHLLAAAAVVASWFGIQSENLATEFRVSLTDLPAGNAVVVADRSRADLSQLNCDLPEGLAVTLCAHPSDPASVLLVVTGNSSTETLSAARAFVLSKNLKGRSAALTAGDPSPRQDYDAPRWLRAGNSVPFKDFSAAGQLSLVGQGNARLYFRLAPDLHYAARSMVPLRVSFRWKRFPPSASAKLRVMMNSTLVARRSFRGGTGGAISHITLQVPVLALYPRNTLSFEVAYTDLPSSARPEFELQPDSTLDLRGVVHFIEMPRLDLFAKAGFPFTRKTDLAETAIVLPSAPSPEEIAVALNAVAFLGSQTGSPATLVSFVTSAEPERLRGKDLLVIGMPPDKLELHTLAEPMPLAFQDGAFRTNEPSRFLNRYGNLPWFGYGKERRQLQNRLSGETPWQALLQGGELLSDPGRSVVQILAVTPRDYAGLFAAVENAAVSDDIFGNASLLHAGRFESFRLTEAKYPVGHLNFLQAVDFWITRYLLLIPIIVILLALFLAPGIETYVEGRRRQRLYFKKAAVL